MKPRKIVQVSALDAVMLFVVADDGSLWLCSSEWDGWQYEKLPPLPPIEEPEGEEGISLEPTRKVFPTTIIKEQP